MTAGVLQGYSALDFEGILEFPIEIIECMKG